MTDRRGSTLGKYRILDRLGEAPAVTDDGPAERALAARADLRPQMIAATEQLLFKNNAGGLLLRKHNFVFHNHVYKEARCKRREGEGEKQNSCCKIDSVADLACIK